jgi:hypothetical protein
LAPQALVNDLTEPRPLLLARPSSGALLVNEVRKMLVSHPVRARWAPLLFSSILWICADLAPYLSCRFKPRFRERPDSTQTRGAHPSATAEHRFTTDLAVRDRRRSHRKRRDLEPG